ncbi:hypothetical protein PHMEG_000911 [Phytophthora megakarya]|uniref:Reverse transcriptase n=1 Tax=Phytophthora megakarya TaxID=4795 RepID=A0A225X2I7_9STRA|nr:hypothetical protein PHMEG_000911 [Phytophthora megakarya]
MICIDYKIINTVPTVMVYTMPLVEDLLTDLENGLWAIMVTLRARKISAFVCPPGHFEWLRIPFGLKNAPMIYQRMID